MRVYPFFPVERGSRKERKIHGSTFESEQLGLGSGAAWSRKTAEFPACGSNAMARNNDRNRVFSHGLAHFLRGSRLSGGLRYFAVGPRLSRRNFARGFIDLPEKRSNAFQVHGDAAKVLRFSF